MTLPGDFLNPFSHDMRIKYIPGLDPILLFVDAAGKEVKVWIHMRCWPK